MLRISKKADYAVFLLGTIARQGAFPGGSNEDSVVSAHEIARLAGLNKSVVANLLKEFTRHGLLDSVRGLRGGYRLARAPADVSLGEILEVVEGKFVLVDCVGHDAPAADASSDDTENDDAANDDPENDDPEKDDDATEGALLPQAASMKQPAAHGGDCALMSFCPSKQPMRIVHERISRLFAEIHLDELCSMTPVCSSTSGTDSD